MTARTAARMSLRGLLVTVFLAATVIGLFSPAVLRGQPPADTTAAHQPAAHAPLPGALGQPPSPAHPAVPQGPGADQTGNPGLRQHPGRTLHRTLVVAAPGGAAPAVGLGKATQPRRSSSPAGTQTDRGAVAVAYALRQRGVPYLWGGSGPADGGFDCSGLVQAAWRAAGIELPRVAADQADAGIRITRAQLRPGDLVFLHHYGHVQLYIGHGMVVQAPHTGTVVSTAPLPPDTIVDSYGRPRGAGAPTNASAPDTSPNPLVNAPQPVTTPAVVGTPPTTEQITLAPHHMTGHARYRIRPHQGLRPRHLDPGVRACRPSTGHLSTGPGLRRPCLTRTCSCVHLRVLHHHDAYARPATKHPAHALRALRPTP